MAVLHAMSLIIERMQAEIRPHIPCLIHYLPSLWDSSSEHGMLCCAIISTLTTVVQVCYLLLLSVCKTVVVIRTLVISRSYCYPVWSASSCQSVCNAVHCGSQSRRTGL